MARYQYRAQCMWSGAVTQEISTASTGNQGRALERVMLPVSGLASWVVVCGGSLMCLSVLGINVQPLLTVGGVSTVLVGLSAQSVLANLISGINLVSHRPIMLELLSHLCHCSVSLLCDESSPCACTSACFPFAMLRRYHHICTYQICNMLYLTACMPPASAVHEPLLPNTTLIHIHFHMMSALLPSFTCSCHKVLHQMHKIAGLCGACPGLYLSNFAAFSNLVLRTQSSFTRLTRTSSVSLVYHNTSSALVPLVLSSKHGCLCAVFVKTLCGRRQS